MSAPNIEIPAHVVAAVATEFPPGSPRAERLDLCGAKLLNADAYWAGRLGCGCDDSQVQVLVQASNLMLGQDMLSAVMSVGTLDGLWNLLFNSPVCNREELMALLEQHCGLATANPHDEATLQAAAELRQFTIVSAARLVRVAASFKPTAEAIAAMFGNRIPEWFIPLMSAAMAEAWPRDGKFSGQRFRQVVANTLFWANWPAERVARLIGLLPGSLAATDFIGIDPNSNWVVIL